MTALGCLYDERRAMADEAEAFAVAVIIYTAKRAAADQLDNGFLHDLASDALFEAANEYGVERDNLGKPADVIAATVGDAPAMARAA